MKDKEVLDCAIYTCTCNNIACFLWFIVFILDVYKIIPYNTTTSLTLIMTAEWLYVCYNIFHKPMPFIAILTRGVCKGTIARTYVAVLSVMLFCSSVECLFGYVNDSLIQTTLNLSAVIVFFMFLFSSIKVHILYKDIHNREGVKGDK